MRGSRVLACASLRAIECYLGDRDGTSVLLSDHEPLDPDQISCQRWIDRNLTINLLLAPRQ